MNFIQDNLNVIVALLAFFWGLPMLYFSLYLVGSLAYVAGYAAQYLSYLVHEKEEAYKKNNG